MTRIEFNKETRLFEIVQNKNNKVLARSTGLEGAQRIMDKWDYLLDPYCRCQEPWKTFDENIGLICLDCNKQIKE